MEMILGGLLFLSGIGILVFNKTPPQSVERRHARLVGALSLFSGIALALKALIIHGWSS